MGQLTKFSEAEINQLISLYDLNEYVETGTGESISLSHAFRCNFQNYHTVDLDTDWTLRAKSLRIPDEKTLEVSDGYSTDFLVKLVPSLTKSLFFLDAHFPFADFHKISYEESIKTYKETAFPLDQEIRIIQSNKKLFESSVIIIDDWVLYDENCNCEWSRMGNSFQHRGLAKSLGIDLSAECIYRLLSATHNLTTFTEHQGYLLALPKQ